MLTEEGGESPLSPCSDAPAPHLLLLGTTKARNVTGDPSDTHTRRNGTAVTAAVVPPTLTQAGAELPPPPASTCARLARDSTAAAAMASALVPMSTASTRTVPADVPMAKKSRVGRGGEEDTAAPLS